VVNQAAGHGVPSPELEYMDYLEMLDLCDFVRRKAGNNWAQHADDLVQSAVESYIRRDMAGKATSFPFCWGDAVKAVFEGRRKVVDGKTPYVFHDVTASTEIVEPIAAPQCAMDDQSLKPPRHMAESFRRLINELLNRGFTAREIAQMAGLNESRISQIRREK
jgi:hypothetical protein